MFSRKFFASILLAVSVASSVSAAPWPFTAKHTTHRVRDIAPDFQLTAYHPESSYEVRPSHHDIERQNTDVVYRHSVMA